MEKPGLLPIIEAQITQWDTWASERAREFLSGVVDLAGISTVDTTGVIFPVHVQGGFSSGVGGGCSVGCCRCLRLSVDVGCSFHENCFNCFTMMAAVD